MASEYSIHNFILLSLIVIFAVLMSSAMDIAEDAGNLLKRGINAYEHADFDRAIAFLDAAIAQGLRGDEDLIAAYKFIALARIGNGHAGGAAAAFRKAISLNPSLKLNPNEYSSKVIKLFQRVQNEMVDTLTVISNPERRGGFCGRQARRYYSAGFRDIDVGSAYWKEAADVYRRLTRLLPDNAQLWLDLGDIYKQLDEVKRITNYELRITN